MQTTSTVHPRKTDPLHEISVQYIKGVGPARKKLFENLGVETVEDLLYLFPRRYEDRRKMTPIAQVAAGEFQTVNGEVVVKGGRRSWYARKHVSEAIIDDKTGRIFAVWFNQPYLEKYFRPGVKVILYGKVEVYKKRLQMVSPEYEIIQNEEGENLNVGRIAPIYPLTRGISQRYLRKVIRACLDRYRDELQDVLPVWLRNKHRLSNIRHSIEHIHFPPDEKAQEMAHYRISFEEFFLFQIAVMKRRAEIVKKEGISHKIDLDLLNRYKSIFPFPLTGAQNRVLQEMIRDMQKPTPMLRLLQGDVGSGKTLVALFGCVAAVNSGCQAAVMAPTEILARQHYENIRKIFQGSPLANLRVELLVSGQKKSERDSLCERLKNGEVDILVGTHALLSEGVDFKSLSFVVIDEQHKFGVRQRALLSSKGVNPDVLVMTATPIPRTLTLTLFGDLDVSVLDELPPGKGKIETRAFKPDEEKDVYALVRSDLDKGRQAYIVYPIVEESEKLDLKAAEEMFKRFTAQDFKNYRVGLVHGQMKRQEAEEVMEQFKNKKIQVLVATTVLEVGIDVPNASVMVIEHAERFGLSQLHQLRGRIGRGKTDGLCLLISDPMTEGATARLEAICSTTDGFKIAEHDLLIRGPGHYFGRHQHGLNELRFANPATQLDILKLARQEAEDVVHKDPDFKEEENTVLKRIIQSRYPNYLALAAAG